MAKKKKYIKELGHTDDACFGKDFFEFNTLDDSDDTDDINDDKDDIDDSDDDETPEEWNLVNAMDMVYRGAYRSQLKTSFFIKYAEPLAYLRERLSMTDIQIIVIAKLIDAGKALSWRQLGEYLNLSRLSMMVYSDDMEDLVNRGWIENHGACEDHGMYEGFALERGVVTAIRNNQVFQPKPISGFTITEFVKRVSSYFDKHVEDRAYNRSSIAKWFMKVVEANQQLPICQFLKNLGGSIHDVAVFFIVLNDYVRYAGTDEEGVNLSWINCFLPDEFECELLSDQLADGTHILFEHGVIEYKCEDGLADTSQVVLTKMAKDNLLCGYKPRNNSRHKTHRDNSLLDSGKIIAKDMFYNKREKKDVERLTLLLDDDHLTDIQTRLEEQGMRKGFACLFYGAPGTGKTETVLQIARLTGRDIKQVDISSLRDKYVGETEKHIREVFDDYAGSCEWAKRNNRPLPILFFNEADAIFSKRSENVERSVDKMENAIQNIILQQMEQLDGILIATTNLTSNLDKAFERRFIYKVEFFKPDDDVKAKIWKSMLHNLTSRQAMALARSYDFSGGQIENIARKSTVDYILTGKYPSMKQLNDYCSSEMLDNKKVNCRIAGFAA